MSNVTQNSKSFQSKGGRDEMHLKYLQVGMVIGFFTSYPMKRWLLKWGIKEVMG
jgi:hypothetical protein